MSSNQSASEQEKSLQQARAAREAELLEDMATKLNVYIRLELIMPFDERQFMLDAALKIDRKSIAVKALDTVRAALIPVVPESKG